MQISKYANRQGVTQGGGHHGRGPVLVSRRKGHGAAERQDPEGGQSLFELVVAIAVSALVIVAIVSLVSTSIRNATFSKNSAIATSYAGSATEWLRSQRDADINTFVTNVTAVENSPRCFNNLDWTRTSGCGTDTITGTPFSREITFSQTQTIVGGSIKTVYTADIVVSWTDSQGIHEVAISANFSDWRQR